MLWRSPVSVVAGPPMVTPPRCFGCSVSNHPLSYPARLRRGDDAGAGSAVDEPVGRRSAAGLVRRCRRRLLAYPRRQPQGRPPDGATRPLPPLFGAGIARTSAEDPLKAVEQPADEIQQTGAASPDTRSFSRNPKPCSAGTTQVGTPSASLRLPRVLHVRPVLRPARRGRADRRVQLVHHPEQRSGPAQGSPARR